MIILEIHSKIKSKVLLILWQESCDCYFLDGIVLLQVTHLRPFHYFKLLSFAFIILLIVKHLILVYSTILLTAK